MMMIFFIYFFIQAPAVHSFLRHSALRMASLPMVEVKVDTLRRWTNATALPSIDQNQYRLSLSVYADRTPKSYVMMVYGPKSVGKSRIIMEKINEWRREGRLVIDIDLKGIPVSADDLFNRLVEDYTKWGLSTNMALAVKQEKRNLFDMGIATTNAIASFAGNDNVLAFFSAPKQQEISDVAKFVQATTQFISDTFIKAEKEGIIQDKFSSFVSKLEEFALTSEKPPLVIIREVQKLVDDSSAPQDAKKLFSTLFTSFEQYKQRTKSVGIIIESSEYLWSDLRRFVRSSPESFLEYQVQPWQKTAAYSELVEVHKVFSKPEFEQVWKAVGGHAGQVHELYDILCLGFTLKETISVKNLETLNMIISIINGADGRDFEEELVTVDSNANLALDIVSKKRLEFLAELQKSKYVLDVNKFPQYRLTIDYLFKSNILWVDNGKVKPIHKAVQTAIAKLLKH